MSIVSGISCTYVIMRLLKCFIFSITMLLIFNSCGFSDGGVPCHYNKVATYMVIDSIVLDAEYPLYEVYSSFFRKSDNKPLTYGENYISEHYYFTVFNVNCISSNQIKVNDTIFCSLDTITAGACSPVLMKIHDDYDNCFDDWFFNEQEND